MCACKDNADKELIVFYSSLCSLMGYDNMGFCNNFFLTNSFICVETGTFLANIHHLVFVYYVYDCVMIITMFVNVCVFSSAEGNSVLSLPVHITPAH